TLQTNRILFQKNPIHLGIHNSSARPLIIELAHNAQLRGEQRYHPNLKHCTVNTKFEVEAKVPSVVNPS
ncbi:hypothetical protein, partial [Vibrio vulnificus]|uniref:hypothetical protein n=1 Tax=Vibrio vulnificus TaxID=672 RepID=UPI001ED9B9FF